MASQVYMKREAEAFALGVDAIDFYVARRQLGWAGHVCRMDFDRLPRRMLSSWVPHKRPPPGVGAARGGKRLPPGVKRPAPGSYSPAL